MQDAEVSIFETTIRLLGGLLSAYALTKDAALLDKAVDLGDRLYAAIVKNAIPEKWVNLIGKPITGQGYMSLAEFGYVRFNRNMVTGEIFFLSFVILIVEPV